MEQSFTVTTQKSVPSVVQEILSPYVHFFPYMRCVSKFRKREKEAPIEGEETSDQDGTDSFIEQEEGVGGHNSQHR